MRQSVLQRMTSQSPFHESERRAPARLVGLPQVRAERELVAPTAVPGPNGRPELEVEATHEPERRAPVRPVVIQQVRAERELGAPSAVFGPNVRLNLEVEAF